jgi:hypothetical protein
MRRSRGPLARNLLAAGVVALLVASGASPSDLAAESRGGFATFDLGAGLLRVTSVQTLSGSAYWDTFCASQDPLASCAYPEGITYVAPGGIGVLTQTGWSAAHAYATADDGIVEFDPVALENLSWRHVDCVPGIPFYPGSGTTVWISCASPQFTNYSVLEFDYATNTLAGQFPTSIYVAAFALDTQSGLIDAAGWNYTSGTAVVLTFSGSGPAGTPALDLTNVQFTPYFGNKVIAMTYDPASNSLVFPADGNGLLSVALSSGVATIVDQFLTPVSTVSFDPSNDQLFVATFDPSDVIVLNGGSFTPRATIPVPGCVEGECSVPDNVQTILFDPAHGDAYLVATVAIVGVNLTTFSTIGAIADYGDGPQESSAYVPAVDRVFGTFDAVGSNSPGIMVALSHGSFTTLSSLLWLPTSLGILALSAAVGLILGVTVQRLSRRGGRADRLAPTDTAEDGSPMRPGSPSLPAADEGPP